MSAELLSPIPSGSRNHLDAPCPKCGGRLANCEAGNIPGAVVCEACGWQGEHLGTSQPWLMESGGAVARFRQHIGRPWGARGAMVRVRCDIAEKGRWNLAAQNRGQSLSEWIRDRANEAS